MGGSGLVCRLRAGAAPAALGQAGLQSYVPFRLGRVHGVHSDRAYAVGVQYLGYSLSERGG